MAQPAAPAKRPAHFDEDRDQQKRQRRDTERSDRHTDDKSKGSRRSPPARDRRDRSPRKERDHSPRRDSRRDRSRERERPRQEHEPRGGERERGRERLGGRDRDRRADREGRSGKDPFGKPPDRDDAPRGGRQPPSGPSRGAASARAAEPGPRSSRVKPVNGVDEKMDIDSKGIAGTPADSADDMEAKMMRLMGFKSFRSTQNTKVPGNDKLYGVRKEKKTEYRQYMNRVGGFNRPLSPSHD